MSIVESLVLTSARECARTLAVCRRFALVALLFMPAEQALGQQSAEPVRMQVYADQASGAMEPVWNYFGYDEPNYSYAPNGKKLLGELGALSPAPVYVRVHNLFTSGNGSSSLKWGSTNVCTEDGGHAIYSWTIVDRIFDAFHGAGIKPLVEIGFMPQALSTHPEPYRHSFPNGSIYTGWAYPPKDYREWAELVFQFVHHLRERYGDAEVKSWLWEVWNEPDIGYWQGAREEFFELYDYSAEAILRALPGAKIGGPDTTGPAAEKAAEFLRLFLQHCAHEKNFATQKTGAPLDFISYHPKGAPKWLGDHVQMGVSRQLASVEAGFKIVASFPEWRSLPIVLGESDPEGCAACSAKENPQNSYRNGPLYAAYTVEALKQTMALASRDHVHLLGVVTWAFEFEDQPPFEGFRELATNGIDKPVLNAFRMLGLLGHDRLNATSTGALNTQDVLSSGVRERPDINLIAARGDRDLEVLVWNYHDDDASVPAASIDVAISGLPETLRRGLLEKFSVDSQHSNAFAVWEEMGSPKSLSIIQQAKLESAGQLELWQSPEWVSIENGKLHMQLALPRNALALTRISW